MFHWPYSPQPNSSTLRNVVDRIRNSLEATVVLQTAVTEVASLLDLDGCIFFWCHPDRHCIQVVCEYLTHPTHPSCLGQYEAEYLGHLAPALFRQDLIVSGSVMGTEFISDVVRRLARLRYRQVLPANFLGFSTYLLLPVKGQLQTIGYLACLGGRSRQWRIGDIEFMQSLAQQLDIALHQAHLYEQTQRQAQRERLVNQITTQTRQSFDLEVILTEAIAQLLEVLRADRCLVHLVEPATQTETSSAFRRKHLYEACRPPFMPSIDDFDTNGPLTQWVIQNHRPVAVHDVLNDTRIGANNPEYQQALIKSSLVLPVQANHTLQGILYLNQCSHQRYWSEFDQTLAQAVADQLAISLQQANLYAVSQQQAIASAEQARCLAETLQELQATQARLIQSEKMSSLGQLVAGLAHEINNPMSFIYSNLPYLKDYVEDLLRLLNHYQTTYPHHPPEIQAMIEAIDLDFLRRDCFHIITSMLAGAERIRQIVLSLRTFSRLDEEGCKLLNVHDSLENCLSLLQHQLHDSIHLVKHYGSLPTLECYPSLLNQVFMGLLMNALEAVNDPHVTPKVLTLRTETIVDHLGGNHRIKITIANSGEPIPPEIQSKIFDPFFTTKDVGKGRGLGLAISYQIIVNQHHGQLECYSEAGKDTEFVMELPVRHIAKATPIPPMQFS